MKGLKVAQMMVEGNRDIGGEGDVMIGRPIAYTEFVIGGSDE